MVDKRGTFTPAEHLVLELLRTGPAETGRFTEEFVTHRPPTLWRDGHRAAAHRPSEVVRHRTVDRKLARKLAEVGMVSIDAGGLVELTPLGVELLNDKGDAQ